MCSSFFLSLILFCICLLISSKYLNDLVTEEVLPNGSRYGFGYDSNGNVVSVTQSTIEGEENSNQKVYKYGEVVALNSNNNHIEYTYDEKRRVTKVNLDDEEDYIRVSYDEITNSDYILEELKEIITYKFGDVCNIYDWKGRLIAVDSNCHRLEYRFENELLSQVYDNILGDKVEYRYDDYERVLSIVHTTSNNNLLCGETNTYTSYGLLSSKTLFGNSNNLNFNQTYRYQYSNDSKMNLSFISLNNEILFNLKYDVNGRNKGKKVYVGETKVLDEEISYLKLGDHTTLIPSSIKKAIKNGIITSKTHSKATYIGVLIACDLYSPTHLANFFNIFSSYPYKLIQLNIFYNLY